MERLTYCFSALSIKQTPRLLEPDVTTSTSNIWGDNRGVAPRGAYSSVATGWRRGCGVGQAGLDLNLNIEGNTDTALDRATWTAASRLPLSRYPLSSTPLPFPKRVCDDVVACSRETQASCHGSSQSD